MSDAVFLCGECGNYFSTIIEIKAHSCWLKSKETVFNHHQVTESTSKISMLAVDGLTTCNDLAGSSNDDSPTTSTCQDELTLTALPRISQIYSFIDDGKWTDNAVKLLINLYKENESEFRKPDKKKREVWETIAVELNKEGHIFTTEQVDTKWRNLKKSYWRSKEAQCEIGGPPKCSYEEMLDDVFGQFFPKQLQDKSTNPRVLRHILQVKNDEDDSNNNLTARGIKRHFPFPDKYHSGKSVLKESASSSEKIADILSKIQSDICKYEEDKKAFREEKLRLHSQMHEEKLSVLKQLIELFSLKKMNCDG